MKPIFQKKGGLVQALGMVSILWAFAVINLSVANATPQAEQDVLEPATLEQMAAEATGVQAELMHAIMQGQADVVENILNTHATTGQLDVNEAFGPDKGLTYFALAIQAAQHQAQGYGAFNVNMKEILRIMRMLKKAGSDMAAKVLNGRTALQLAIQGNNQVNMFMVVDQLMRWYKKKGHSFDMQDNSGRTALHYAAQGSDVRVIDRLVGYEATINIQDAKGATPLHFAGGYGTGATVQALVCHKADKNMRDKTGATALDWALERKDSQEKDRVLAALKNSECGGGEFFEFR